MQVRPAGEDGLKYSVVKAYEQIQGGSQSNRYRMYNWVSSKNTRFTVPLAHACADPQSGIYKAEIGWGSNVAIANLVPFAGVAGRNPMDVDLETVPFANGFVLTDATSPADQPPRYLNLQCVDGWWGMGLCPGWPVKVDTTPPFAYCTEEQPILGAGVFLDYQSDNASLRLRGFQGVLYDAETGLQTVTFELRDLTAKVSTPLPKATVVQALPSNDFYIRGLNMTQNHEYRVVGYGTNRIGDESKPCESSSLLIDITPPRPGNVFITHFEPDARTFPNNVTSEPWQMSESAMRSAASLDDPESGVYAQYVSIYKADGTLLVSNFAVETNFYYPIAVTLQYMESYYVEWTGHNRAGLSTTTRSPIVSIDITPPVMSGVYAMGFPPNAVTWLRDAALNFTAVFSVFDHQSGFDSGYDSDLFNRQGGAKTAVTWCIGTTPGACDFLPFQPTDHMKKRHTASVSGLVDGVHYYIYAVAYNRAGGFSQAHSAAIQLDNMPPLCGSVIDGPLVQANFVGPSALRNVAFLSAHGGSAEQMAVGDMPVSWTPCVDLGIGLAGQAAGLQRVDGSDGTASDANHHKFTDAGLGTSVTMVGVELAQGASYRTVLKVWDKFDNTAYCHGPGFLWDATPPEVGNARLVSLDATAHNVQKNTHELRFVIDGIVDPQSGLLSYRVAVGSSADEPESIAPYTSHPPDASQLLLQGLDLPQGWSVVSVTATNRAYDHAGAVHLSVGVDSNAPVCSAVTIDHDGSIATTRSRGAVAAATPLLFTKDASSISASWYCVDVAPWEHTPISCEWAVGVFPQDASVMSWVSASANATLGVVWRPPVPLEDAVVYYASVHCTDHVYLSASASSRALMVDTQPPRVLSSVRVMRAFAGDGSSETATWVNGKAPLVVTWAFGDDASGLASIRAQLTQSATSPSSAASGASISLTSLEAMPFPLPTSSASRRLTISIDDLSGSASLSSPLSQDGAYYLHACAADQVGWTSCSMPFTLRVDRTPPVLEAVTDLIEGVAAPKISSLASGFATKWAFTDAESGVASVSWMPYMRGLDGVITALEVAPMSQSGGAGTLAVADMPLVTGARYYSCVEATNYAGEKSNTTCTVGFIYDGTKPTAGELSTFNGSFAVDAPGTMLELDAGPLAIAGMCCCRFATQSHGPTCFRIDTRACSWREQCVLVMERVR